VDKQLHDIEAEKIALGMILYNDKLLKVAEPVIASLNFFYDKAHRTIYAHMLDMADKDINSFSLAEALGKSGKLKAIGGRGYLSELEEEGGEHSNIKYFALILRDYYIARQAKTLGGGLVEEMNKYGDFDAQSEEFDGDIDQFNS